MRTLSLSNEHGNKLEKLILKYLDVNTEIAIDYDAEGGSIIRYGWCHPEADELEDFPRPEFGEWFHAHNWLYITMVILPQHIGDWHLDANWMVTHMTAKTLKHPIDYLYEKYIDEEK